MLTLNLAVGQKKLFTRMIFIKRQKTSTKAEIQEKAPKDVECLFLQNIVTMVKEHHILPALIVGINQTPLKYVSVQNESLLVKGAKDVTIEGSVDKRYITGTFKILLGEVFFPFRLIHDEKSSQSISKGAFPDGFSSSANPKHFLNTEESLKYLRKIIVPT